jgi:hypothetical protein
VRTPEDSSWSSGSVTKVSTPCLHHPALPFQHAYGRAHREAISSRSAGRRAPAGSRHAVVRRAPSRRTCPEVRNSGLTARANQGACSHARALSTGARRIGKKVANWSIQPSAWAFATAAVLPPSPTHRRRTNTDSEAGSPLIAGIVSK